MERVTSPSLTRIHGRHILTAVLLVGVVLVGVLTMHTMMSPNAEMPSAAFTSALHEPVIVAAAVVGPHETAEAFSEVAGTVPGALMPTSIGETCSDTCTLDWLMAGMICGFAILAAAVAILLLHSWYSGLVHRFARDVVALNPLRTRCAQPPSLLVLSISRT